MALFVKKKDGNLSDKINEEDIGFSAIENYFSKIHNEEVNPKHFYPKVAYRFGGVDPLDEVDVYVCPHYYHFVTYGFSELYEKKSNIKDISGYGMELTLMLDKKSITDDDLEDIYDVLQDISRVTFEDDEIFKEYDYIDFGDNIYSSKISGFIIVPDPIAKEIDTLNGKVKFLLLIGVTKEEIESIKNKKIIVKYLYNKKGELTYYK